MLRKTVVPAGSTVTESMWVITMMGSASTLSRSGSSARTRPGGRCGYGLLYEVSKWKKKSAPDEAAFLAHIERIDKTHSKQPVSVLLSMGGALLGIGTRSKKLHAAALRVAKKICPIEFDPSGKCAPADVAKNLSHDLVKKRLGL